MLFQEDKTRSIFVCQSVRPVPIGMLLDSTTADVIFCKQYGPGHVYVIKFNASNNKKHSTVDKRISLLDLNLMTVSNTSSTFFNSIVNNGSSKVASFSGDDRIKDPLYRQVFNVTARRSKNEFKLHEGVDVWTLKRYQENEIMQDRAQEREDILVQQQAMEEDPDAFGGSTTMTSGSKMMAATASSVEEGICMDSGESSTEEILFSVIDDLNKRLNIQRLSAEEELAAKEQELITSKIEAAEEIAAKTVALGDALVAAEEANASKIAMELVKTAVEQELMDSRIAAADELAAKTTALEEALAAKTAAEEALASNIADSFMVNDDVVSASNQELKDAFEKASIAKNAAYEQDLLQYKTSAEKALAAKTVAEAALVKESRRLSKVEMVRDELTVQRNGFLLEKIDLESKLKDAYDKIRTHPKKISDALKKKNEFNGREGAAQITTEVARKGAILEEEKRKEIEKLEKRMKNDSQKQESQLQLKISSLELEVKNLKSHTQTLKDENRAAVKDLAKERWRQKVLQKETGEEGCMDPIFDTQFDSVEIEKLHAQVGKSFNLSNLTTPNNISPHKGAACTGARGCCRGVEFQAGRKPSCREASAGGGSYCGEADLGSCFANGYIQGAQRAAVQVRRC